MGPNRPRGNGGRSRAFELGLKPATPGYLNALDWVLFEPGPLRLVGVAPLPPVSELLRDTALPSAEYPSDHVSLCADLDWSGEGA